MQGYSRAFRVIPYLLSHTRLVPRLGYEGLGKDIVDSEMRRLPAEFRLHGNFVSSTSHLSCRQPVNCVAAAPAHSLPASHVRDSSHDFHKSVLHLQQRGTSWPLPLPDRRHLCQITTASLTKAIQVGTAAGNIAERWAGPGLKILTFQR